jgi:hypothetical protein
MIQFEFDTSGAVYCAGGFKAHTPPKSLIFWPELSPFVQGYVEALLSALNTDRKPIATAVMVDVLEAVRVAEGWTWREGDSRVGRVSARYEIKADPGNNRYVATPRPLGFSDLAPETLARIMEDCERIQTRPISATHNWGTNTLAGKMFWRDRATGFAGLGLEPRIRYSEVFPPLTVYLGDDGKVYLREAGR